MKVREDGRSEAEIGQKRGCHAADFEAEEGALSPDTQAPLEAAKGRETDSPLQPPEGASSALTWTSVELRSNFWPPQL